MTLFEFSKVIFNQYKFKILIISSLLFLGSLLEIFGIATLIPLLAKLLGEGQFVGGVIGEVLEKINISNLSLNSMLLFIFLFMGARGVLLFFSRYIIRRISVGLEESLKLNLMDKYLKVKWNYHLNKNTGEITNIINRETEASAHAVYILGRCYTAILTFGILMFTSMLVSWYVILIVFILCIPIFLISKYLNHQTQAVTKKRIIASNKLSGYIIDILHQYKKIKANAIQDSFQKEFGGIVNDVASNKRKNVLYSTITISYPEILGVTILITIIGIIYNFTDLVFSDILFTVILMHRAYGQIANFQELRRTLSNAIPSFEIVKKLENELDYNQEMIVQGANITFTKEIKFEDVFFSYDNKKNIVHNLNISIGSRGSVAIVGKSGAGKTTIVDLIVGLLRVNSGNVSIDDTNINTINIKDWRKLIAYVPQDPVLRNISIKDNILSGNKDVGEDEFNNVLKLTHVDEFIYSLPNGIDTNVGERGTLLSGGQRQRIILAQALVRKPRLLILDEATSSLDNSSVKHISDTISKLSKRMSIIVIAHSLQTLQNIDKIYFLSGGAIVEEGTFKELISLEKEFYKLHKVTQEHN